MALVVRDVDKLVCATGCNLEKVVVASEFLLDDLIRVIAVAIRDSPRPLSTKTDRKLDARRLNDDQL